MTACARAHPFRLNGSLRLTRHDELNRLLEGTVEQAFALARLDDMYQALPPSVDCDHFLQQTLDAFHIRVQCADEALQRVPASGALVVVANHTFGALEGVILAQLLRRVRPDVKILANYFLERIPELRDLFISVDPFGGDGATGRNLRPLKQALTHLQDGGLLVVFPAGEVSRRRLDGSAVDPHWHNTVARLVRRTAAPVLPVYFPGSNSLLFHLAGLLHPRRRPPAGTHFRRGGRTVARRRGGCPAERATAGPKRRDAGVVCTCRPDTLAVAGDRPPARDHLPRRRRGHWSQP